MRFSSLILVAALGLVPLSAACVGGKQQISAEDKERLKPYILDAVPADAKKTDVNFENKVHLVGYKIEPEQAGPGANVKLTYYWRCDEPLDEGWRLFTHIQHEGFAQHDGLDGVGPLREARGQSQVGGHRDDLLAHQHPAFDPHALLHGHAGLRRGLINWPAGRCVPPAA